MPKTEPFDIYTKEYEEWFVKNKNVYLSEINLIRHLMENISSVSEDAIEIGVGTGLFASKLGIKKGVEPSEKMAEVARNRGIDVVFGVAENLPLKSGSFSVALMVTTICFVDDPELALKEVHRILKKDGCLIIGFVDKNTKLGKFYLKNKEKSKFYKPATFFSTEEIVDLLKTAGFKIDAISQTLNGTLSDVKEIQPIEEGFGKCAFVGIRAIKS